MAEDGELRRQPPQDAKQARQWNLGSLALTLPLLLVGYYYYGAVVFKTALIAALAAVCAEWMAGRILLGRPSIGDYNAVVVGVWIACMLPADQTPLLAAAGAVFAVLVAKVPFGGTQSVLFSPAAAGLAFLTVCFPGRVFQYQASVLVPPAHSSSLALMLRQGRNALEGRQVSEIVLGQSMGPMGTGCAFVLAFVLVAMLCLRWRRRAVLTSVGMLVGLAVPAFLFPRVMLPSGLAFGQSLLLRLAAVGMELTAGYVLFAAVFLLPDPAISPHRWFSRLGWGGLAGALVFLLRSLGSYEENACFAILLANAAVPVLYRIESEISHQRAFRAKLRARRAEQQAQPGAKEATL